LDRVPEPEPKRTVLAYIAGENSLYSFAYDNIRGMLAGAGNGNLNGGYLLVYVDTRYTLPCLIQIKKGEDGTIISDTIKVYEEQNSASVEVMQSVLNDVFNNAKYKTASSGLILWSHGTAWLPSDVSSGGYLRAFGQDNSNWMELNDLRDALAGYKFDFILFDACYMGNVEVLYALRDNADYILSSPTEVIANGMPYPTVVKTLFSDVSIPGLLRETAETFMAFYEAQQGYAHSASIALAKTSGLEALASVSREIFAGKGEAVFDVPLADIQVIERLGFPHKSLYDFKDFTSHVAGEEPFGRFEEALSDVIIYKATTEKAFYGNFPSQMFDIDSARFCGISSYLPQRNLTKLNEWYKQLDWYKAVYQ
jgi:hypothetical protein